MMKLLTAEKMLIGIIIHTWYQVAGSGRMKSYVSPASKYGYQKIFSLRKCELTFTLL